MQGERGGWKQETHYNIKCPWGNWQGEAHCWEAREDPTQDSLPGDLSVSPPGSTRCLGSSLLGLLALSLGPVTPVSLLSVVSHELDDVSLSIASFYLLFADYTFACYKLNKLNITQD